MELIGEMEHVIGTGFRVINFPAFEIQDPSDPDESYLEMTPEAKKRANEVIEYIKKSRGEFISGCVDVEYLLGESISRFFLEKSPKREILHELILDTPFFSFKKKKNILQSIMKKYPNEFGNFSDEQRNKFFTRLENIIRKRNAMAHGVVIIDLKSDKAELQFYDENKNKMDKLLISQKFFQDLKEEISTIVFTSFCDIAHRPTIIVNSEVQ